MAQVNLSCFAVYGKKTDFIKRKVTFNMITFRYDQLPVLSCWNVPTTYSMTIHGDGIFQDGVNWAFVTAVGVVFSCLWWWRQSQCVSNGQVWLLGGEIHQADSNLLSCFPLDDERCTGAATLCPAGDIAGYVSSSCQVDSLVPTAAQFGLYDCKKSDRVVRIVFKNLTL